MSGYYGGTWPWVGARAGPGRPLPAGARGCCGPGGDKVKGGDGKLPMRKEKQEQNEINAFEIYEKGKKNMRGDLDGGAYGVGGGDVRGSLLQACQQLGMQGWLVGCG